MEDNFADVKVMVIDDSKTIRRTSEILLSRAGCKVVTAVGGFEALAKIIDFQPAIVFVDINMPGIDGYQTCALIKNNPYFQNTPVIIMSDKDDSLDLAKARSVAFDHYLQKPFSNDELLKIIRAHSFPANNGPATLGGETKTRDLNGGLIKGSEPDLSPLRQRPSNESLEFFLKKKDASNVKSIGVEYQKLVSELFQNNEFQGNLRAMSKLLIRLSSLCGDSPTGNLAELGLAIIDGLANGGITLKKDTMLELKKIGMHLESLSGDIKRVFTAPIDKDLAINLITLINQSKRESKRIGVLRGRYVVKAPKPRELKTKLDDETMSLVAASLLNKIHAFTEKTDLLLESQNRNFEYLDALLRDLAIISQTLQMIGGYERYSDAMRGDLITESLRSGEKTVEEILLSLAKILLMIGSELGGLLSGAKQKKERLMPSALTEGQEEVIRETRLALSHGIDKVLKIFSSKFDLEVIEDLTGSLKSLREGLIIVGQYRAGDVLEVAANYLAKTVLDKDKLSDLQKLDDLADLMTSVDYYLQKLVETDKEPDLEMLAIAEKSAKNLANSLVSKSKIEMSQHLVDDEMLEIFTDEAEEILGEVAELLLVWKKAPTNEKSLAEMQLCFDQLKSASRAVKALLVSHLAEAVENILARAVQKTVIVDAPFVNLVSEAIEIMPECIVAFKEGRKTRVNPEKVIIEADTLVKVANKRLS